MTYSLTCLLHTIHLQIHSLALSPCLICCHTQVATSVGHLSRVNEQRAVFCKCVSTHIHRQGHVLNLTWHRARKFLLCHVTYLGLFPASTAPCFLHVTRGGGTPLTTHSSTTGLSMCTDTVCGPSLIVGATERTRVYYDRLVWLLCIKYGIVVCDGTVPLTARLNCRVVLPAMLLATQVY